jgi:hypothetical protein
MPINPEGAATGSIDLANGATQALLHRPAQVVPFHLLRAAQAALLEALARDLTLGEALDAAQNVDPAIDLVRRSGISAHSASSRRQRCSNSAACACEQERALHERSRRTRTQRAMRLRAPTMIGSESRAA